MREELDGDQESDAQDTASNGENSESSCSVSSGEESRSEEKEIDEQPAHVDEPQPSSDRSWRILRSEIMPDHTLYATQWFDNKPVSVEFFLRC